LQLVGPNYDSVTAGEGGGKENRITSCVQVPVIFSFQFSQDNR